MHTEPPVDIDPLTGEAWARRYLKGSRGDRIARGDGTVEWAPGQHLGGNNPAKHREYMNRPEVRPEVSEWADDGALADYEAEQRWLDQLSEDLYKGALDDEPEYTDDADDWYDYESEFVCPDPSCCFCGTCDCDSDEVG